MLDDVGIDYTVFSDLHENPRATEVMEGAELYKESGCDVIVGTWRWKSDRLCQRYWNRLYQQTAYS